MGLFKKKKVENELPAPEEMISFDDSQDFSFVQLDKSIHDVKFKTKPTTYFKDALKRFVKSKSSVTAAVILGILILMAVIVPVADSNDIERNNTTIRFLPPKWWDADMGGFLDGTEHLSNVLIDPDTGYPALPVDNTNSVNAYVKEGVMGEITTTETLSDGASDSNLTYGRGGYVAIRTTQVGGTAEYVSPMVQIDLNLENTFAYTLQEEYMMDPSKGGSPSFGSYFVASTGEEVALSSLNNEVKEENSIALNALLEEAGFSSEQGFIVGNFLFRVQAPEGGNATAYVKNVTFTQGDVKNVAVSWSDSTAYLNGREGTMWTRRGGCQQDLEDTTLIIGSFRYDYYAAAFREDTYTFTEEKINEYIRRGFMTYEWAREPGGKGTFALTELGEEYCPIRAVNGEVYESFGDISGWSLSGVRSRYRFYYDEGYISQNSDGICYLFGTTEYGKDFFKVVFSGLLFSLALGFLAAIINITIGIVWGSISGYFGGWVDLLMERMTEILGGMPFVVLMTLIVLLLGSTFWTFLFALCLTGWIGMAATTRSQFYRFKGREYVLASRTLGASDARLIFRHILPNGVGMMVTSGVLMIPSVIFSEATISYLLPGIINFPGAQSFGVTLSTAQGYITTYPYMIVSASLIMAIIMICFNLFGNGLRDAFNPSMKGAQD